MYIRTCRYRIRPEARDEFLRLKREMEQIYREEARIETDYFMQETDGLAWLEIRRYADEENYGMTRQILARLQAFRQLSERFSALLEEQSAVEEEGYYHIHI